MSKRKVGYCGVKVGDIFESEFNKFQVLNISCTGLSCVVSCKDKTFRKRIKTDKDQVYIHLDGADYKGVTFNNEIAYHRG